MHGVKSVDIKVIVRAKSRPAKGKASSSTVNLQFAWTDRDFYSHVEGVQGDITVVGNSSGGYVYTPRNKTATKVDGHQAGYLALQLQRQLSRLLGTGPLKWNYEGIKTQGGHSVDVVSCEPIRNGAQSLSESISLDRTTHLPRRVVMHATTPEGSGDSQADFTAFDLNPKLPASLFRFTPPRGTRITIPKAPPAGGVPMPKSK